MLKILVSSRTAALLAPKITEVLGDCAHHILKAEETTPNTAIDIAFVSRDVTGRSTKQRVLPSTKHFYDVLRSAPGLAWVQMHSAGADRPVWGELMRKGASVTTGSGANAGPVAHTALAGLLALSRNFPQYMAAQRERKWDQEMDRGVPRDLRTQTAVIVGWGPVAQEIARLLRAVGLNCIAVRRKPGQPSDGGVRMITFAGLDDHLNQADWLILAGPLTDLTRSLVNRERIARLPPGARVINVSRGEVVVQSDLVDALHSGQLAGAYLDVTDPEPLPAESPLWTLENVILTPHTAGHSNTNEQHVASIFLDNLARWRNGTPLANLVQ